MNGRKMIDVIKFLVYAKGVSCVILYECMFLPVLMYSSETDVKSVYLVG